MRIFVAPALLLLFLVGANVTQGQTVVPSEEFVGPFSSWKQVQCSGTDDTATLQNELNSLGRPGNSPVLYLKPGTCRITATLTLQGREKVTFLGADPGTTKIVWAGAAGGTMFWINGVGHSRFGRITWDHGGIPGDAIDSVPDSSPGNFFPTDNRHEDEIITDMVVGVDGDLNIGARVGKPGGLADAETTWTREQFTNAQAAMLLGNDSVLDHWVWDSLFQNNRYGVTNTLQPASSGAAGGYSVNRSVFLDNVVDLAMGSTTFTSERWNYSRGAKWGHFDVGSAASAANRMTIQGVRVYGAGDTYGNDPIAIATPGPLAIFDSTFLSPRTISLAGSDVLSVGNRFSNPSPYKVNSGTRVQRVDDQSGTTVIDPGPPSLPSTPQNINRAVFEPTTKDSAGVQAAINQAAASTPRAVVHLPYGDYTFTSPVSVPANASLQLVGDGLGATVIGGSASPLITLNGPTQVVVRDFSLAGNRGSTQGILVTNANQANGLVHFEDLSGRQGQVGLLLSGLNQTLVDSLDSQINSTSSADYRATGGSTLRIFNGATCCSTGAVYDVQGGSTIVAQNMYLEDGGPAQLVAPNGNGTVVADVGKVMGKPGTAANTSTFNGTAVLQNLQAAEGTPVIGGPNTLLFGIAATPAQSDASVRQHEAALRAAVPQPLTPRGTGITDLRVYRLGGDTLPTFISISGTPGLAPSTAAQAPAPTSAPATTATTPFVSQVTQHAATRSNYTGPLGMQITIGGSPVAVTDLGRFVETGNTQTHPLSIIRASDGATVATANVNLATATRDAAGFAYAPLASPVTLNAGGVYYVVSQETSGGDTFEGWPSFPTLAHTTAATIQGGVWKNGSTWAPVPGATSWPDQGYVPVTFKYQSSV